MLILVVLGQTKGQIPADPVKRIELIDRCIAEFEKGLRDLHMLQKLMILCQQPKSVDFEASFFDDGLKSTQVSAGTLISDSIWNNEDRADRLFNTLNDALQPDKVRLF